MSPAAGVEIYYDIQPGGGDRNPVKAVTTPYGLPFERLTGSVAYESEIVEENGRVVPYDDLEGIASIDGHSRGMLADDADGRAPYVWANHVDPSKTDQKTLSAWGGFTYLYEADGRGGKRLCRVERWVSRTQEFVGGSLKPRPSALRSPSNVSHPVMVKLDKNYVLVGYSNLTYDAAGRLPHVGATCFYYKSDGQVDWTEIEGAHGECTGKKPDPKVKGWAEVVFDKSGRGVGAFLSRPKEKGDEEAPTANSNGKGGWTQVWRLKHKGSQIYAEVDNELGLKRINAEGGSFGALDDDPYTSLGAQSTTTYQMVSEDGGGRGYEFPRFTSPDLLRNLDKIYDFDRVRTIGKVVQLFERFGPGPGRLSSRLWVWAIDAVARQEFFKDGKLVRAVVSDYTHPEKTGKLWAENWADYRPRITAAPFDLVYLRVYDYDAGGKESLVAIGWTDFPRDAWMEQRTGSKRAMVNKAKEQAARLVGQGKWPAAEAPEELKYSFATPDGKKRYASFAELNKVLGPFQTRGLDVIFPSGRRSGLSR